MNSVTKEPAEMPFFQRRYASATFVVCLVLGSILLGEAARVLGLDADHQGFQIFWPPLGLYFGAFVRLPWKRSWLVFIGAYIATITSDTVLHGVSPLLASGYWVGDTLGVLAGGWIVKRCRDCDFRLERVREVWILALGGFFVTPLVNALSAATLLSLTGVADFKMLLLRSFLGASLGCLVVAPLVLSWSAIGQRAWVRAELSLRRGLAETLGVVAAMSGTALLVFHPPGREAVSSAFFPFWIFLPVLWCSLRFPPRFACLLAAGAMLFALERTANGFGPFAAPGQDLSHRIILIQGYLAVVVLTALTLSASIQERLRAEEGVRASELRLSDFFDNANDLIHWNRPDGTFIAINKKWCETLGYRADEVNSLKVEQIIHPDSFAATLEMRAQLAAGAHAVRGEAALVAKDGRRIDVEVSATPYREKGEVAYYRVISWDVTARKQAQAERERLIVELQTALQEVKTLKGFIPICSCCKKIRTEAGAWKNMEDYLSEQTGAEFTHGICAECGRIHYGEYWKDVKQDMSTPTQEEQSS